MVIPTRSPILGVSQSMRMFRPLLLSLLLSLISAPALVAQVTLSGEWSGTMTVGGIYSNRQLPMKLFIVEKDGGVEGRSYVTLPSGEVLRMDLRGALYGDLSMQLVEVKFGGDPHNDILPEFNRQYQIVYRPDLYDSELRGYWQEVTPETAKANRKRGRMLLRKVKGKGA